MKTLEPWLLVLVPVTVIAAWIAGARREESDLEPPIRHVLPEARAVTPLGPKLYAGVDAEEEEMTPTGYACVGTARGYGGPLSVVVGLDPDGRVTRVVVLEHRETLPYFQRVTSTGLLNSLRGKTWRDIIAHEQEVDAVSGATQTSTALTVAVSRALRRVASEVLKEPVPAEAARPFSLGVPDIVVLLLFVVGFAGYWRRAPLRRQIRWVSLFAGLILIGFVYNVPLTIVDINALLLGYWPAWQSHLHWYFMGAGVLLATLLVGRSPYCESFCPFGAAQECLAVVGGARKRAPRGFHRHLPWIPRLLAWGAILVAVYRRNPGLTSYEPFGTLFDFTGSVFQFVLLGVVIGASVFVVRPWCRFLCPMRPVTEYLRRIRRWLGARPGRPDVERFWRKWRRRSRPT